MSLMRSRQRRWIAPVLFGVGMLVTIGIWLSGVSLMPWRTSGSILLSLGRIAGLIGFYLALWQLLLIGRIGWIEKAYGHDKLSRIHHLNGLVAVGCIAVHPFLITLGYSWSAQREAVDQFWLLVTRFQDVIYALAAYMLFMSIFAVTFSLIRKRLKYEWWYYIHLMLYLAIVLAFGHQYKVGADLSYGWQRLYWYILVAFVGINVLCYRFWLPIWRTWRHSYHVASVEREGEGYTTVTITGRNLQQLPARAGQFMIVRFLKFPWCWQAHPFSLSEMPNGRRLRATIKHLGDFTSTVGSIPVGTPVLIDGPHGIFTSELRQHRKAVLIAGGIGITPLRALFEEYAARGREVDLVYAARTKADLVLSDELLALATQTARVHLIPEDLQGRITKEMLLRLIPDISTRDVFLCGPPPMMRLILEILLLLGIPKNHVYFEKFLLG